MHTEGYCSRSPLHAVRPMVEGDSVIGMQCIQKVIIAVALLHALQAYGR